MKYWKSRIPLTYSIQGSTHLCRQGNINAQQLKQAIEGLGFDSEIMTIAQLIKQLDKMPNKSLNFDEFFDLMIGQISDKDTREDIGKAFKIFDEESKGRITVENLRSSAKKFNEEISDQELKDMIELTDTNKDGEITLDDFYSLMTKQLFK